MIPPSLGFAQGFITAQHRVPEGYIVLEIKQCENCPGSFSRERGSTVKYCGRCRARALMPDLISLQTLRDMLPTPAEMKHADHLPHYDTSLVEPVNRVQARHMRVPSKKRSYRRYGNWKERLEATFRVKIRLTLEEIQDVIGCPGGPDAASTLCRNSGFKLTRVGNALRKVPRGKAPGLYSMAALLETEQQEMKPLRWHTLKQQAVEDCGESL